MSGKIYVFSTLAILLIIFTIQNTTLINIKFLFWEISNVRLIFILLLGLILGFSIAIILQFMRIRKPRRELKIDNNDPDETEDYMSVEEEEKEDVKKEIEEEDDKVNSEGVSMGSDYKGGFF